MDPHAERVLAVDDEQENLEFVQRALFPRTVDTFRDPLEALEQLKTGEYAVVISDQRMPRMIGTEFLASAARIAPDTTRILLTAFADVTVALDAVNKGGVSAILCKPVETANLVRQVERAEDAYRTRMRLHAQLKVARLAVAGSDALSEKKAR